jgi:hypothetical protein
VIGVIGSEDSVVHILAVARQLGREKQVVSRSYASPQEAARLAQEIDGLCDVILFTGRVPYEIALAEARITSATQYVPYTAVDLYRCLVVLSLEHHGVLPRLSIDTIDRGIVEEAFHEVGVEAPSHLYPLDDVISQQADLTDRMVEFHRSRFRAGEVDVCVTCMSTVRDQLLAEGVPVTRVRTTDSSVRDSLTKAAMTSQLQRSESAQVAVLAVAGGPAEGEPDAGIAAIEAQLADVVDGRLVAGESGTIIVTTRGALEGELRNAQLKKVWAALEEIPAWLGVGFGHSLPQAEQNSNYARTVAVATRSHHEVFPDGSTRRLSEPASAPLQMRNTNSRMHALRQGGGIGPMTLSRLQAALLTLGRDDVTARELAQQYGVEPRSARRLLAALHKAGIAHPLGAHAAPRAGRPQVVYKIDLQSLIELGSPSGAAESLEGTTVLD